MASEQAPDKLSIVVYDHHFDKVHYALVTAAAAAAIGKPVTLFFTMGACRALSGDSSKGVVDWHAMPLSDETASGIDRDRFNRQNGVAGFDELLEACRSLDVRFMVCEMGLRAKQLDPARLRADLDIEITGMVSFLNDASRDGAVLFI